MQESNPFNRLAEAARKPAAILATTATLAAGVALETPAVAPAQPPAPHPVEWHAAPSPQEQQKQDAKNWPWAVAALVATLVAGYGAVWATSSPKHK